MQKNVLLCGFSVLLIHSGWLCSAASLKNSSWSDGTWLRHGYHVDVNMASIAPSSSSSSFLPQDLVDTVISQTNLHLIKVLTLIGW